MTSKSFGENAAIAKTAFQQTNSIPFGFTTEDWIERALELFDELDSTRHVYWNPLKGELVIQDVSLDIEDADFVGIARECKEVAFVELSDNFIKNGSVNAKRIVVLLGSSISMEACDYIIGLVDSHGIEGAAALTNRDQIGLSVFESEDGSQELHYGDYGNSHSNVDAVYCHMSDILDAASSHDDIPSWWDDSWTVVEIRDNNAYGYSYITKDALNYRA